MDDSVLSGWSDQLESLIADEAGLIMAVTQLRGMRRTTDIALANMVQAVRSEVDVHDGVFGDDRAVIEWFGQQLDDAGAIIDRAVSRRREQRQERLTRRQTAIVGRW